MFNVPGTLSDPKLALYRREAGGAGRLLFVNGTWMEHPDSENTAVQSENLGAFALDPESKDAALVVTLLPGAYTVVGSSAIPGETGVVLMEIYAVPGQH